VTTKLIITLCGWCPQVGHHRRQLETGEWVEDEREGDYPVGSVSHGMCPDCYKREFEEADRLTKTAIVCNMPARGVI